MAMTGFTVDLVWLRHPRARAVGQAGRGAWLDMALWAVEMETDGFLPGAIAKEYAGRTAVLNNLVTEGLLIPAANEDGREGYILHAFHKGENGRRRESREEAEERRRKEREKKAAQRRGRAVSPRVPAVSPGDKGGDKGGDSAGTPISLDTTSSLEVPPPNPPQGEEAASASPPRVRPRRIEEPFRITEQMRAWAAKTVPNLDLDRATADFVDYWVGEGKAKADWYRTWQGGMRSRHEKGRFLRSASRPAIDPQHEWRYR